MSPEPVGSAGAVGDIPIGPFVLVGDDSIGRGVVETLRTSRSPAVLMRNHGPLTLGATARPARPAVEAAVTCEDVAHSVHVARRLGGPVPRPGGSIDRLHDRYQSVYGQR